MSNKNDLTKKQQEAIGTAGALIEETLDHLEEADISTREFALVRTKLEEADMWYDRALDAIGYRYADEGDDDSSEDDGSEGGDSEDDDSDEGEGKK